MSKLDRFRGCLNGGAAGDALGYAVEFLKESQIKATYGTSGITEYRFKNGIALISDDTQMTLFTAEGLLLSEPSSVIDRIRDMYKAWLITQKAPYPSDEFKSSCRLLGVPELYSERAPGITCFTAIENGALGSFTNKINTSKGCGGVMRVAPIGLYYSDSETSYDESDDIGAKAAALTHTHELGYIPAAALVHIIRRIVESDITLKDAVVDSIDAMQKLFQGFDHIEEFTDIMNRAVMLSESDISDIDAIHELGEGWVAEETLAIAVYCVLKYPDDLDMALRVSVNHNGDSDSTGAVTGNILGAYLGYEKIPQKYKDNLELHDLILKTADELYSKRR